MDEHDTVVLTVDIPEHQLRAGDLGTIVMVHRGGAGFEVEFVTLSGDTVAVLTLLPNQVRSLGRREIAQARTIEAA
jgi:hypothetical protein